MIWWNLILFVASFILVALLAPKPKIENAKKQEFDPNSFPRATQADPIPLIIGMREMKGPNTIWYGDFQEDAITKKQKTGLFSSKRVTVGYKYYLGVELALCLGPNVRLHKIRMEKKTIWTSEAGVATANGAEFVGSIGGTGAGSGDDFNGKGELDSLWGGDESGGGVGGTFRFYSGQFTSKINAYVQSFVGAGLVPAYNGVCRIVFENFYVGESPSLRQMDLTLSVHSNLLGYPLDSIKTVNIAECIYLIMVDTWRGLSIDPAKIDLAAFKKVAQTLQAEKAGAAVLVSSASEGKEVIRELMNQAELVMYQDPDNGLITIKAIRDDYVINELLHLDESDIVSVRSFTKTTWEQVFSEIKVEYGALNKDSAELAIVQDMSLLSMFDNQRSQTLVFPFLWDKAQAQKIVERERGQLTVPLARITLELKRNQRHLLPGTPFTFAWEEYGIAQMVFRVQNYDIGELLNGKIVVNAMEDEFASGDIVFAEPEVVIGQPPVVVVNSITLAEAIELPYLFSSNLEVPVVDGEVIYTFAAQPPSSTSTAYDTWHGPTTSVAINDPGDVPYQGNGELQDSYSDAIGYEGGFDPTGFVLVNVKSPFTPPNSLSDMRKGLGGLLYVNGEWMGFLNAVSIAPDTWRISNVYRGLLGSRPMNHAAGAKVWEITSDQLPSGAYNELVEGQNFYWAVGNQVGSRIQGSSGLIKSPLQAGTLANRPVRPALPKVNDTRSPNLIILPNPNPVVTWIARNRAAELIAIESDAAQTPDRAETYDVDVMVNGVKVNALSGVGVSSPFTIPFSSNPQTPGSQVEARVFSRLSGGNNRRSAQYGSVFFQLDFNQEGLSGDQNAANDAVILSGDESGVIIISET